MRVADAVAVAGHEVHVCRYREARTLLRWLGEDLRGLRVLDVAAGDGYWAAQTRKHGARAVALDLAGAKLSRGQHAARRHAAGQLAPAAFRAIEREHQHRRPAAAHRILDPFKPGNGQPGPSG